MPVPTPTAHSSQRVPTIGRPASPRSDKKLTPSFSITSVSLLALPCQTATQHCYVLLPGRSLPSLLLTLLLVDLPQAHHIPTASTSYLTSTTHPYSIKQHPYSIPQRTCRSQAQAPWVAVASLPAALRTAPYLYRYR